LPRCSEADFQTWRDQQDWTEWKYAKWERGEKLPSQKRRSLMKCQGWMPVRLPRSRWRMSDRRKASEEVAQSWVAMERRQCRPCTLGGTAGGAWAVIWLNSSL